MYSYRTAVVWLLPLVLLPQSAKAVFTYSDFSSVSGLTLVGNAQQAADRLRLTQSTVNQRSAAWCTAKQNVGAGFDTTFTFKITYWDSVLGGGDGFAFVVQNSSEVATSGPGGGLGYGGYPGNPNVGIANSLAVEFDTYPNSWEPNGNHISVQSRGTLNNSTDHLYSLGAATGIPTLEDSTIHTARIRYLPAGSLQVFVDDLTNPALTVPVNLATKLSLDADSAWVGFTAATASAWENTEIHTWNYTPEPGTLSLLIVSLSPLVWSRRRMLTSR